MARKIQSSAPGDAPRRPSLLGKWGRAVAATVAAWRAAGRKPPVRGAKSGGTGASLERLTWQEFEQLAGEVFRQKGYKALDLGSAMPDAAVDLVVMKGGERFLVQYKQWKMPKVGVEALRALHGLMVAQRAAGGIVITAGTFSAEAQDFARGRKLTLVDGERLVPLLQMARVGIKKRALNTAKSGAGSAPLVPNCPACGAPMVRREAMRGVNAGRAYWGCSTYPACRGTVQS